MSHDSLLLRSVRKERDLLLEENQDLRTANYYAFAAARLLRGMGWSLAQIERQTQINEAAGTPSEDTE